MRTALTALALVALSLAQQQVAAPTSAQVQWMYDEIGAIGHFNMVCCC